MDEKIKRIHELVEQMNEMRRVYYTTGDELVSNAEYDALFDELEALETETGVILPDSPTTNVGYDEDDIDGEKEDHEYPALSLPKSKKVSDLVKWVKRKLAVLSWKLDGLTLVVTYDNGILTKVITRGNGITGTNITHKAAAIKGIPEKIPYKGHLVIRGEACISYSDFNRFIIENDANYKNPRNLASGSLSLNNIDTLKDRNVVWIPFTLIHVDMNLDTWTERMEFLKNLGFSPVDYTVIDNPTEENIQTAIDAFTERVNTGKMDIPVDGLVLCYNDWNYSQSGKNTGHHSTTGGFAFKWEDAVAESKLISIEWSCATNAITPVAIFEPVELEGTTVGRASLCNISECRRLGLKQNSKLSVIKSNKIIPKIIKAEDGDADIIIPCTCPACSEKTEIKISESNTETLVCTNPECPAKQLSKFKRFVSKQGMNIDGMSVQTIAKLVNKGWITDFSSIFNLQDHTTEWMQMEGFGEKSVNNAINAIEKAKTTNFVNFMYALSIPNFGLSGIVLLKECLDNYYLNETEFVTSNIGVYNPFKLLAFLVESVHYDFTTVPTFGQVMSDNITTWTENYIINPISNEQKGVKHLINTLVFTDKTPTIDDGVKDTSLAGLTFVVTGRLETYDNRNAFVSFVESKGGKISDSISKNTSYLVNNDANSTSSKNKKAKSLGVPIITEEEFNHRFNN